MVIQDTSNDYRDLLRVLGMPFQIASLMFVGFSSLFLSLFLGGDLIRLVMSIAAVLLLLVWLTQYALTLIDDAANGVRETRAASVEMASSFTDARAWIHPGLGVATWVALYLHPDWPRVPVIAGAAALLPASLGAIAMSGHALHALHPVEMARVVRGMGILYPLTVVFFLACGLLGLIVVQRSGSLFLAIAVVELLLLLVYAGLGGVLYLRRRELGFEPRQSPERLAQRAEDERRVERQKFIDGLYRDVRVRESTRAVADITKWLQDTKPEHLRGDLHAILEAGKEWSGAPREYPRMLRGLVPVLLAQRQPALALSVAEAALEKAADFSLETEDQTSALAAYALQTGRRRAAARLLDNFLRREGAVQPGPSLQALRERLQSDTSGSR
jgi:hypothetical protein